MKPDTPGLLLVNLGTPEAPERAAVRRYLRGLLSDPRVLDIPVLARWLLVNAVILPSRTAASTEAYRKIWTEEGSPLRIHGEALRARVQEKLGHSAVVRLGMCLGSPSIPDAFEHFRRHRVPRIVVLPLYPQASSAATGSALAQVFDAASASPNVPALQVVPPFFDHPAFLDAHTRLARPVIDEVRPEWVFFSFHGLPERQVKKGDPSGSHCLASPDCCVPFGARNLHCFRAQCFRTAELLCERLGLEPDRAVVTFQSRLGRTPWIRPLYGRDPPRSRAGGDSTGGNPEPRVRGRLP